MDSTQEIRSLLQTFQDGYSRRDLAQLDAFMELFTPAAEVIGTNGLKPGVDEWYTSRASARQMIKGDWESWGDLRLDVDSASIQVNGSTGWVAVPATLSQTIGAENYAAFLEFIKNYIDTSPLPPEQKLHYILRGASNTIYELHRGEKFVWALRLTAVVGMPIRLAPGAGVSIAALVLGADGSLAVYTKQHLHPGEAVAFVAGQGGVALESGDDRIALAVCADFSHASHPRQAAQAGATVYAAGVLISKGGYATDSALLQGYAAEHGLVVLMANHGGPSGGWACAGRSAIWAADGHVLAAAPGVGDALVIAHRDSGRWTGRSVALCAEEVR